MDFFFKLSFWVCEYECDFSVGFPQKRRAINTIILNFLSVPLVMCKDQNFKMKQDLSPLVILIWDIRFSVVYGTLGENISRLLSISM